MNNLHFAFIHAAICYGQPAHNREVLQEEIHQAGKAGAQVVIAPELALSGYAFANREEIVPLTEIGTGPTYQALAPLCREHGLFCCFGFAEKDQASGLLFNSAAVIDPCGNLVLCYRKINAECRWASPGNPYADNTFATPWGRMGVLICSDSYHALMPRITALRGAVMLLIPANWPLLYPQNGIDPLDIWRARALENGCYVAACNRGGIDKTMDCRNAVSALVDPQGSVLHCIKGEQTTQLHARIPLDGEQQLPGQQRVHRLAGRNPQAALAGALHLGGIEDWAAFHQLPQAGMLKLCCHHTASVAHSATVVQPDSACVSAPQLHLFAVQEKSRAEESVMLLHDSIRTGRAMAIVCFGVGALGRSCVQVYARRQGRPCFFLMDEEQPPAPPFVVHYGPARVAVVPPAALYHPEYILACAKQGCDLVVVFAPTLHARMRLLAGVRTIEQVIMVLCTPDGAAIYLPPRGHERWQERRICRDGLTHCVSVDIQVARKKHFQDLIDYATLLQ